MNNIIIVAHKFVYQPDDDLVLFLNKEKKENVLHIYHSFHDAPDRKSFYKWYKRGKLYRSGETADYKRLPEPAIYIKEFLFTVIWIFKTNANWDFFIGMDGLCTNFGILLRMIKKVKEVAYWAIDFVPEKRFKDKWKNRIYQWININGYKNADQMWDLSPRMREARKKYLGISEDSYKKWRLVPYGVWLSRIDRYPYKNCQKNTLVFMGNLLEKQGVQQVIKQIHNLIKKKPDFRFKIIGDGGYKQELVKLARDLKVLRYCDFKGKIDDQQELEREIAISCLAIAPYVKELDTWTYFADPGKVKTFLACGVPVLLTDLPWNAKQIEENGCGKIIDINSDFTGQILKFMNNNDDLRKRAYNYAKSFDYQTIFKDIV